MGNLHILPVSRTFFQWPAGIFLPWTLGAHAQIVMFPGPPEPGDEGLTEGEQAEMSDIERK